MFRVWVRAGPFKCYVTQLGGGVSFHGKKRYEGVGGGQISRKKVYVTF